MRIRNQNRIGPGDDLGEVTQWDVGEASIHLTTSHEIVLTLDPEDLTAVRAALAELEAGRSPGVAEP